MNNFHQRIHVGEEYLPQLEHMLMAGVQDVCLIGGCCHSEDKVDTLLSKKRRLVLTITVGNDIFVVARLAQGQPPTQ